MDSIFTIPYAEYAVIEELTRHLHKSDGYSVFVPASRQEKGVDFLMIKSLSNSCLRFQVKSSRTYTTTDPAACLKGAFRFHLWFKNFVHRYRPGEADFYVLFGLYPHYGTKASISSRTEFWKRLALCFTDSEIGEMLPKMLTKREKKPESFFDIGFDSPDHVVGERGFSEQIVFSDHLLSRRVDLIRSAFS